MQKQHSKRKREKNNKTGKYSYFDTQKEVSEAYNIPEATLSRWLNGTSAKGKKLNHLGIRYTNIGQPAPPADYRPGEIKV